MNTDQSGGTLHRKGKFAAIILARGGSKRLPGKNIRPLMGKALISWTIEAAIQSLCFDMVLVSSDSAEILALSKRQGAETSLRPEFLSGDDVSSEAVISSILDEHPEISRFALLQPTSPLRTAEQINEASRIFLEKKRRTLVSANVIGKLNDNVFVTNRFHSHGTYSRTRGKRMVLKLNGAIYMSTVAKFKKNHTLVDQNTFFYLMDDISSIDIDTEEDFFRAVRALEEQRGSSR